MKKYGRSGWFKDSYRHYLAAKGISTKKKYYGVFGDLATSTYAAEDARARARPAAITRGLAREQLAAATTKQAQQRSIPQEELELRKAEELKRRRELSSFEDVYVHKDEVVEVLKEKREELDGLMGSMPPNMKAQEEYRLEQMDELIKKFNADDKPTSFSAYQKNLAVSAMRGEIEFVTPESKA